MSRISASLAQLALNQKSSKGVSLYSRFVNRPAGRFFAAVGHLIGMTPNQMTLASAVCTFSAIALLALTAPAWSSGILVAALLILGFILDSSDGQLARLTGTSSASGEWLDHVVDCARSVLIHTAVLVSFYTTSTCRPSGCSPSHWCFSSPRWSCSSRARWPRC